MQEVLSLVEASPAWLDDLVSDACPALQSVHGITLSETDQ
ncbi:hypothetical protein AF72_11105 [Xylella taiwanensis]|uniref:Uncharacterized protein n=1 Tax=Xylella taiwanensis TaxID=1444770 RepID=Z9JGU8_9GAMM|nr:hypothetical protein AF72_11105 [Xylella taiwanensis]